MKQRFPTPAATSDTRSPDSAAPTDPTTPGSAQIEALGRELMRMLGGATQPPLLADPTAPRVRLPVAVVGRGAEMLARRVAGNGVARRDAAALYGRCLTHFRQNVQPGLLDSGEAAHKGEDDLGFAAAYFVLVNLAARSGSEPEAPLLAVLEQQMRGLLRAALAPLPDQQSLFEQLAILAVLVNESRLLARRQGAAAQAHVQRAADAYLHTLLGPAADGVQLTPQGLVVARTLH